MLSLLRAFSLEKKNDLIACRTLIARELNRIADNEIKTMYKRLIYMYNLSSDKPSIINVTSGNICTYNNVLSVRKENLR